MTRDTSFKEYGEFCRNATSCIWQNIMSGHSASVFSPQIFPPVEHHSIIVTEEFSGVHRAVCTFGKVLGFDPWTPNITQSK